jgi:hypothetical protein
MRGEVRQTYLTSHEAEDSMTSGFSGFALAKGGCIERIWWTTDTM